MGCAARLCAVVMAAVASAGLASGALALDSGTVDPLARACPGRDGPARRAPGSLPSGVVRSYSVLRRAQVPADVPPSASDAIGQLGGVGSYDPGRVRLLIARAHFGLYLIPGRFRRYVPSQRCRAAIRALPLDLRMPTLGAQRAVQLEGLDQGVALCLVEVDQPPGWPPIANEVGCERSDGPIRPSMRTPYGPPRLVGVAPDGVSVVRLRFAHASRDLRAIAPNLFGARRAPRLPPSFTARELRTLTSTERAVERLLPSRTSWLGSRGRTIVSHDRPRGLAHALAQLYYYGTRYLTTAVAQR